MGKEEKEQKRENENMKEEDKIHIDKLNAHVNSAKLRAKYGLERFDILIISLSSGGIALSATFFEKFEDIDKLNVFWACIFFSVALVINLLSQVTGYYANNYDIKYTLEEIRETEKKKYYKNYKVYDCYKNVFNVLTTLFNLISLISFIVGIICLLLFINNLN
ncbi:hypothetical protein ACSVH2_07425 [Flavobacterium sp. RSB2_4_14]|uniref:hypothetical protein n=1 Tax=Flavobacterium sp. RSB2_4_14 TaxID=3447665 RepID=UPI003F324879